MRDIYTSMTSGIYKITNKLDGKYYLGSAQDIIKRWRQHVNDLNNQSHVNIFLQRAWNKNGSSNFELQIVFVSDGYSRDELFKLEQQYLNSLDNKVYNLSKVAKGGDNLTYHPNREEIIAQMSASMIERYASMTKEERTRISEEWCGANNPMFGKTHSEEARKKITDKNNEYWAEHDHPIKGMKWEDVFGEDETARRKDILSEIASQKTGEKNPFYGKCHTEETKQKISEARKGTYHGTQNIPIIVEGIHYESLSCASKALNIPRATIRWRVLSENPKFDSYQYFNEKIED